MAVSVRSTSPTPAAENPDDDFELFSDGSGTESRDARTWLQQRAEAARRDKLAQLPPPSQRTCAQNRTVYVLSGRRLQPTRVEGVLSVEECGLVIEAVVDYVQKQGGLQTGRHENFATTDVPVSDLSLPVPQPAKLEGAYTGYQGGATGRKTTTVGCRVLEWVEQRVLSRIASATGFRPEDLGLKDLFVVCYRGSHPFPTEEGKEGEEEGFICYPIPSKQASLAIHTDGCLMSFSLLLNRHGSFQGGGTFFKATGETFHLEQGGLLMHDAGLEHAGAEVLSGQRLMLVGFVETVDVLREKMRWERNSTRSPPQRVAVSS